MLSALLLVQMGVCAGATGRTGGATDALPAPAPRLADSMPQLAPLGFIQFCDRFESECHAEGGSAEITFTPEIWALLRRVNSQVNRAIEPSHAKGSLDWSIKTRSGNCNDYAVQKQKALVDAGLPRSALPLSVVETPWGESHLVLGVRTNRGDFVLDNLHPAPVAWNQLGYRWIKRQSQGDIRVWVGINTRPARDGWHRSARVLEGLDTLRLRLSAASDIEAEDATAAPSTPLAILDDGKSLRIE